MKAHHYLSKKGELIQIRTRYYKPGPPRGKLNQRGIWTVYERGYDSWNLATFPEITWGTLKNMEYLGSVPLNDSHMIFT